MKKISFFKYLYISIICVFTAPNLYSKEVVVVGVLAPTGVEKAQKVWTPIIEFLSEQIPDYKFQLFSGDKTEISKGVLNKQIDFFLTNTSHYVELEATHGATRILTLQKKWKGRNYSQWGSVLVASSDNDEINSIEDIRGKRIAAVFKGAFAGYQVGLRELSELGIINLNDTKNIIFTGFPHSSPLLAVQDGRAHVGIIPTGVLEEGVESGNFSEEDFKIINNKNYIHFPFHVSTRLYPYWPLAKSRHTSEKIAELVITVLLRIPEEKPTLLNGKIAGWTVPLEYSSVHELMKSIKVGPYKNYGNVTFKQLLQQYRNLILTIFLAFIAGVVVIFYISRLNKKLKYTVSTLKQAQDQLIESEKMAALGSLVSGVAHEINTPIGIALTTSSLIKDESKEISQLSSTNQLTQEAFKDYLDNANKGSQIIFSSMEKAATLIRSFKQVAVDQHSEEKRQFALDDYCNNVITSLSTQFNQENIKIVNNIQANININSYPGIFSQIFTNLIMNSFIHAFDKTGTIKIDGTIEDEMLCINYMDDGKGIPPDLRKKIFDPFFTSNRNKGGSGLGLHIVYNLIHHKLNGQIICQSQGKDNKVKFVIRIPVSELELSNNN